MTALERDEIVSVVINALSPLTWSEREMVLKKLVEMRGHWFVRPAIKQALAAAEDIDP